MQRWNRIAGIGLAVVATLMVFFQATYAQRIFVDTKEFLIGHLGFAILVLSLAALTTLKSKAGAALQVLVMLVGTGILAYCFIFAEDLQFRSEYGATGLDVALGALLIIVVLVITGREYGWVLPGMAALLLAYGFFGHLIPGAFSCLSRTRGVYFQTDHLPGSIRDVRCHTQGFSAVYIPVYGVCYLHSRNKDDWFL